MSALTVGPLNLIEDSLIVEMGLLRLLPTAEDFVDREKRHLRKHFGISLRDLVKTRTKIVFRGYFLAFECVEVLEILLGHDARAAPVYNFVHPRYRRFGQNTD